MTETMIVMSFLLLMIFGFVHFAMLTATKSMVNLAAFSAARAAMVNGFNGSSVLSPNYIAAWAVLDNIRWWSNPLQNAPQLPLTRETVRDRDGVSVIYKVPFGLPIFNEVGSGGIPVEGFSPLVVQPEIAEEGDNADPK
jgi:hypothetical protein